MRLAAVLPLLLAASPVMARTMPAVPVDTLESVTRKLSSDAYQGRAPNGSGQVETVAYITTRVAEAGLTPGNGGRWTQDVPLDRAAAGKDAK